VLDAVENRDRVADGKVMGYDYDLFFAPYGLGLTKEQFLATRD
jgi:hypothetical protein